jgi:hypothetical protein
MIGGSQPISNDICDGEERGEMEREMREGSEERKELEGRRRRERGGVTRTAWSVSIVCVCVFI